MQAQLLQEIFETSSTPLLVVNNDGSINTCNKALLDTFGYGDEELIHCPATKLIPEYFKLITTHTDQPIESTGRHKSALILPLEVSVYKQSAEQLVVLSIRDTSEESKTRLLYLENNMMLAFIFETIEACLIKLDASTRILDYFCSKTSPRNAMLPELTIGQPIAELFDQETGHLFHSAIKNVQRTGAVHGFEYTLPQNAETLLKATIKPFVNNQIIAFIQTLPDAHPLGVQQTAGNSTQLMDNLPTGIFHCDLAGNYLYQNRFWQELTETADAPLTNWLELIHEDDATRISKMWQQITQEHVPFNAELKLLTPQKNIIYVQCHAVPNVDETGHIRSYTGSAYNISKAIFTQREIEKHWHALNEKVEERTADLRTKNRWLQKTINERKKFEHSLDEERNFSSTVLDTVGVIIMVCNPEGRIVRLNRRHRDLIGYLEEELYGKYYYQYLVRSEDVKSNMNMLRELKVNKGRLDYEGIWKTKSNQERLISWSNTVILSKSNEVNYIVFTGIDVTEQRQAEDDARRHQAELIHVSRLSTMGEMATGLAHELNQPLSAIVNYARGSIRILSKMDSTINTDLNQTLQHIATQAERAGAIIRKLRDFVKKKETQRENVSLEDIVRNTVNFAAADIKKSQAVVTLHFAENLPNIYADSIQIEQVLLNLLRNALESRCASPHTSLHEITISLFLSDNNQLQLSIKDHGDGLPENMEINQVFDAFFTTKKSGMGMGLAISRSIVEAHGGQMWMEQNTRSGCTFHFSLPISQS